MPSSRPPRTVEAVADTPVESGAATGPVADGRAARGAQSRDRLRQEALRLFAQKGYARTATREICLAAGANVASIHYHFGDKAGLYRDVVLRPMLQTVEAAIRMATTEAPIADVLARTYAGFLEPLKVADVETIRIMRVYFREQSDPSGLIGDAVIAAGRAHNDAVIALVVRELGLPGADDDARRLAFCLMAIAADFLTAADWNRQIEPRIYADSAAIDRMVERMTGFGLAMLDAERARRRQAEGGR